MLVIIWMIWIRKIYLYKINTVYNEMASTCNEFKDWTWLLSTWSSKYRIENITSEWPEPLWKVTYRFKVSVFQPGAFDNKIGKWVYWKWKMKIQNTSSDSSDHNKTNATFHIFHLDIHPSRLAIQNKNIHLQLYKTKTSTCNINKQNLHPFKLHHTFIILALTFLSFN